MNFSPQCPWDKVQEIASLINVQRKNQFFQRLMAYWTLKRQTRNGVPLIRRLQVVHAFGENTIAQQLRSSYLGSMCNLFLAEIFYKEMGHTVVQYT
jgi:hypothetical protein